MTAMTKNCETNLCPADIQCSAGIGLRSQHYKDLLDFKPDIQWIEVHPENYFCGGLHRHYLDKACENYALSLHGVGLSLGSDQAVSKEHLQNFKNLIDRYQPFRVSDHVSWSASGNAHLNDLLPLPYTQETLLRICSNIEQTQDFFNRQIWVENPSSYISYCIDEMSESEFMNALADKTGCGILLDINNIYVQAHNHSFDAWQYISDIKAEHVGEMHLAGHIERPFGDDGEILYIDTHSRPVKGDVWDLYMHAIQHVGPTPTLIEWDSDIPALEILVKEAKKAEKIMKQEKSVQNETFV